MPDQYRISFSGMSPNQAGSTHPSEEVRTMDEKQSKSSTGSFQLERRTFILLSAGAMAGLATTNLTASVLNLAEESATLPLSLSVGYVDGRITGQNDLAHVIDARAMTTGDPRFLSSPAEVRVFGFWRADANRDKPVSVTLVPYYPSDLEIGGDAPFYAWNYSKTGSRTFKPATAKFRIPVGDDGIRLGIENAVPQSSAVAALRRRAIASTPPVPVSPASLDSRPSVARLTLGSDSGAMKLQAGTYFIALLPSGAPPPDWENIAYTMAKRTSEQGPLTTQSIFGSSGLPFDYLGLSVDFVVSPVPTLS
jgi:hypothetical protein